MEMPVDILNQRLGKIRDNGDIDFDNTDAAVSIDQELQSKFLFFPIEELEAAAVEIDDDDRGRFYLGSGPEHCAASTGENPNWLLNHAKNALALYWKLKENERLEAEQARIEANRQIIINRRPAPGVYMLNTGGEVHLTVVTADRNIFFGQRGQHETLNVTGIFDGLENKSVWVFTPIQTGLSA